MDSTFVLRFLISNGILAVFLGGILLTKRLLRRSITTPGQYRISLAALLACAAPFLPVLYAGLESLWRWLRGYAGPPAPTHPPLWLGYGEQDRFVMSNRLVADVLPPARVLTTEGGHDWAPWQRLWGRFLDAQPWAGA